MMLALSGVDAPDIAAVTLTVPLVTTIPDQERLPMLVLRLTVLPLPSLNCHPDTVTPEEGVTVQVAVPPRVTEDEQLN
jgi:hypothetical protein